MASCARSVFSIAILFCVFAPHVAWAAVCDDEQMYHSTVDMPEPRIALVMGNLSYTQLEPLTNSINDARDLAAKLMTLGFDVLCGLDLDRSASMRLLERFSEETQRLGEQAVSLFYYSGHGVQISTENYILPLNADLDPARPQSFETHAINLDAVMGYMLKGGNNEGSRFIILDACRDLAIQAGAGWAKPKLGANTKGLYWVYGTGYGQFAYDGGAVGNGVFAEFLLKHIAKEGFIAEQIMKLVTKEVSEYSEGKQVPETGGSLVKDFMFVPAEKHRIIDPDFIPLWLKSLFWTALTASFLLLLWYARIRRKTAWTKGVDLSQHMVLDETLVKELRQNSRLFDDEIAGVLKDAKSKKLLSFITPKYDLLLGRNRDMNIVFDRDAISGKHARLGWDRETQTFWLEDLESTNGTWWGKGQRLETNKRYPLSSGKIFYLADQHTPLVVIAHKES